MDALDHLGRDVAGILEGLRVGQDCLGRSRRHADRRGDGQFDDDLPATHRGLATAGRLAVIIGWTPLDGMEYGGVEAHV